MNRILDQICDQGYYFYGLDEWSNENDKTIEDLVKLELINTLANELNDNDNNNCYIYVAVGNPRKVNWVQVDSHNFELKTTGQFQIVKLEIMRCTY